MRIESPVYACKSAEKEDALKRANSGNAYEQYEARRKEHLTLFAVFYHTKRTEFNLRKQII